MREMPGFWDGPDRIQWGCTLMNLLGENSLENLHVVLSGLRSVERSAQASAHQQAIHTARSILSDLLTKNAVQNAVLDYAEEGEERAYEFTGLNFKPTLDLSTQIDKARGLLAEGLPRKDITLELADISQDLLIPIKPGDTSNMLPIRLNHLQLNQPEKHNLLRQPVQELIVSWTDLENLAVELDALDGARNSWGNRIRKIRPRVTTALGLEPTDSLNLSNLKHMIGLPGAGKSTLISLLCILLARQGKRVAVFFTSIEVSREYLEVLQAYENQGVKVGLLVGQSEDTHRRHANRIAELIAGDGNGGFGGYRTGTELFGLSCPLPAFAEQWPDAWEVGHAPCQEVYEVRPTAEGERPKQPVRRLCPAWSLCGRVKNHRELPSANIWLGHVISADTTVPAHTTDEQIKYFELIAETFDLVIFDEVDETQKALDNHGALTLTLTGSDQSVHANLQKVTRNIAQGRLAVADSSLYYAQKINQFERHMMAFVREIRRLTADKRTQGYVTNYADQLLTASFLIRKTLRAARTASQFTNPMLSAVSDFWESAMYRAFFFRSDNETVWPQGEKYASLLGLSVEEGNYLWEQVNSGLKKYLALDHAASAPEVIDLICTALLPIFKAEQIGQIRAHVRLLIATGFTVASYQSLAKSARSLSVQEGAHSALVFARASQELREVVPRSMLGVFSAVRYRRAAEGEGFEVDYVVMDSNTRMLLQRLHEFGNTNVLLTSATSWLKDSTEFHVSKAPDYVLLPPEEQPGRVSLYVTHKTHPSTGEPLRFSGGGAERDDNLRHMVSALAARDLSDLSELEAAVISLTTDNGEARQTPAQHRMAALIVNSYDQVRMVVEQITRVNPQLAARTRGVVRELPEGEGRKFYVLKGQVEALGDDQDVDVIVFPISAIGRGVNIVFKDNPDDNGKAAVGALYFLTRPHPAAGDLGLMISLLAKQTETLDRKDLSGQTLTEVTRFFNTERSIIFTRIANLLARPMQASSLDNRSRRNFAANLLVPILQTIGRGMRRSMPVEVYFIDAAWAPESARDLPETEQSSILVNMRDVLYGCLNTTDPGEQAVYQALYGVFAEAFTDIRGLNLPERFDQVDQPLLQPSPFSLEDGGDGIDTDFETSSEQEEWDEEDDE